MIKTEVYSLGGMSITRTWSDEGRYVVRDGIAYEEANDPTDLGRTYTEGDYMEDIDPEEALAILLGEEEA